MDLSFQSMIDCVLHIIKNATYEKQINIETIKKLITATNDYLQLSVKTDKYIFDLWLGLGKTEKNYTINGCSIDITMHTRYSNGSIHYELINRATIALMAFLCGITFNQNEVDLCIK